MVSLYTTILLSCLLIATHQTFALNILAIFPFPAKSHFIQFKVYLQELAKRGHNVTVASYFPNENPTPNYHDINLGNEMKLPNIGLTRNKYYRHFEEGLALTICGIDNCKTLARNEQIRELVKRKQKFEVVVYEQFNTDCPLGIAFKLNAPVVAITSNTLIHYHCKRFGVPCNPAYMRTHFYEGRMPPTLYQRAENNIIQFYYTILATIQQWIDRYTLTEYYNDIPALEELARDIKFLLVYHSFIVTGPALLPYNVIEVGGYNVLEAKPMTGELKKFFDEAKQGVIYVNFGSVIKLWELSNETQEAIFGALREFPQRVVMRYEGLPSYVDKTNMYLSNWLPQVDILAHPNTLVFISHAGIGSAFEALHHGVPMVSVPFFGDQYGNAAAIEDSGFGVEIDVINKQSVTSAIKKVLDPMFRAKALQISKLYNDRPMTPLETAVYWTEFVGRNSNFTFRTTAADTPLYQHLYLDVVVVLILILFTFVYLTKMVISLVYCILFGNANTIGKKVSGGEEKSKSE